jgi:hypothetical protein
MERNFKKKTGKVVSGCLLALSVSVAYCGDMGPEPVSVAKSYVGVFGGGGAVTSNGITQSGTAFYFEAAGGPLAVNAFGPSNSSSTGVFGGHIGFEWLNNMGMYLPGTMAAELEGYYMGGAKIAGHDLSNDTTRLPEHHFLVTYPLKTGVFLVNAVLNANNSLFGMFRPYVGMGAGSAVVSISGATAIQLSPAEPGINHYNSNPNDTALTFAAQPKVGVHFDLTPHASVFAEYRFLYLSRTNYTFGSTVAPGHVATSPWLVSIKSQNYNMGTVGIDFDL